MCSLCCAGPADEHSQPETHKQHTVSKTAWMMCGCEVYWCILWAHILKLKHGKACLTSWLAKTSICNWFTKHVDSFIKKYVAVMQSVLERALLHCIPHPILFFWIKYVYTKVFILTFYGLSCTTWDNSIVQNLLPLKTLLQWQRHVM